MNGGDLNNQQQQQQQQQQMQHQQWVAMQQYQQQWMAMQYPAMAMQQHMMYNQHYVPYYQPHQQQQQYQQQPPPPPQKQNHQIQSSGEDNKTIWIGDLQQWMDEGYLQSCFSQTGEVVSVKIIRNKQTGQSERYGFIEFNSHVAAEKVLQSYNGTTMPNTEQPFRLNWAAFSTGDRRPDTGSDLSIFVGDLATDVTDALLHDTFARRYPSVKGAKVVVDANSGRSKGYGFVRFGDENERTQAMTEMNGAYCSSRPMRVGVATPKKTSPQQQYSSQAVVLAGGYANGGMPQAQSENDSSNTTIFVGGLDSDVTDEELRQSFTPFGEVLSVKIPAGKGCGFVQFASRSNAEDAIQRLNGTVIGKQTVRLSWGRNMGNKQEPIPVTQLVRETATVMQEFTQSGGVRPFGVSLLVAGFDDKGPQLYQVDPSGSYFSWKASAMGKNVSNAKTFLEKRYTDDMELDDAVHTAILTLKEGFEGQISGKNIEIGVIGSDKVFKVLTPSEVEDYLQEVE